MNPSVRTYWFPAKRYGWGWGLPRAWQGWAVLLAYAALLAAGTVLLRPGTSNWPYLLYVALLSCVLTAVCYAKGEPPAWRWGKARGD
jgi:hypothetical protein